MQKTPRHLYLARWNEDPKPSAISALPELTLVWSRATLPKPPSAWTDRDDYHRQVYHQLGEQSRAMLDLSAKRKAERAAAEEAKKPRLVYDKKMDERNLMSPQRHDYYPH